MIEVENLYKSYGTKEIFKNQSITLDNHCIYALVGVNGIGKSTFLNAITQPYLLDKGVVKIDGIYSSEFQAKYHYAFVPDTKEMFLNLTGKEYLDFVSGLYNQRERCTDLISDYITNLKLENSLDMTIQTYSLGMKQKIYLIGALISNAQNIILDEPFTNLDQSSIEHLTHYIASKKGSVSIIAIMHSDELDQYADHILEIRHCQLIDIK